MKFIYTAVIALFVFSCNDDDVNNNKEHININNNKTTMEPEKISYIEKNSYLIQKLIELDKLKSQYRSEQTKFLKEDWRKFHVLKEELNILGEASTDIKPQIEDIKKQQEQIKIDIEKKYQESSFPNKYKEHKAQTRKVMEEFLPSLSDYFNLSKKYPEFRKIRHSLGHFDNHFDIEYLNENNETLIEFTLDLTHWNRTTPNMKLFENKYKIRMHKYNSLTINVGFFIVDLKNYHNEAHQGKQKLADFMIEFVDLEALNKTFELTKND
jgi:hypothetical protein